MQSGVSVCCLLAPDGTKPMQSGVSAWVIVPIVIVVLVATGIIVIVVCLMIRFCCCRGDIYQRIRHFLLFQNIFPSLDIFF